MSLIAKDTGGEGSFTPVPPGTHLAKCYRIVDLGTQKSEYQGQIKHLRKIMVQFEVHSEDETGNPLRTFKGEPMSISKSYTLSLAEKATLRKDLQSWRGRDFTAEELRGFELKNILGQWAMLSIAKSIGNNGKEYTNIMSVGQVPASMKKAGLPGGINSVALFSLEEPDLNIYETLGKNLQEKIALSPEWQSVQKKPKVTFAVKGGIEDMADDIPF
jgi:hypothetical protein